MCYGASAKTSPSESTATSRCRESAAGLIRWLVTPEGFIGGSQNVSDMSADKPVSSEAEESETATEASPVSRRAAVRGGLGAVVTGALAGCVSVPSLTAETTPEPSDDDDTDEEGSADTEGNVVFSDDFEDGDADDWVAYLTGGDGSSQVQSMATPGGGSTVLSLSQSEGSGTEYILGTERSFDVWAGPWTIRTAVHTTELDPTEAYQKYELVPGYDTADGDDPALAFRLGVRDGDGDLIPAQFVGTDVGNDATYEVEWAADEWYAVEITHDGTGGYAGTVWPAEEDRPSEPNVTASGPVPSDGARPLALHINGPSYPEFRLSHSVVELRGGVGGGNVFR